MYKKILLIILNFILAYFILGFFEQKFVVLLNNIYFFVNGVEQYGNFKEFNIIILQNRIIILILSYMLFNKYKQKK